MVKGSLWVPHSALLAARTDTASQVWAWENNVCVCVCVCVILYVVLLIGSVIVKPRLCFSLLEMKQKEPRGLPLR